MSAIVIKPKQSIHILLNQAYNMSNPRLSICLEENILNEEDDANNNEIINNNNDDDSDNTLMFENQYKCQNCDALKKMLVQRDKTIMKLIEDRDQLKIKLTKAMNQNIELSRQLIKYQHLSTTTATSSKKDKQQMESNNQTNEKVSEELNFYKKKCEELDTINKQLKQNLYSLRDAFSLLGNVDEYQELPSCSSTATTTTSNSGTTVIQKNHDELQLSRSLPEKINPNATFIVANTTDMVDSSPYNSSKVQTTNHQPKIINNSNQQQQSTMVTANNQDERSNFDLWYNS